MGSDSYNWLSNVFHSAHNYRKHSGYTKRTHLQASENSAELLHNFVSSGRFDSSYIGATPECSSLSSRKMDIR